MKGKLIKRPDDWYVMRIEEGDWETFYPINPYTPDSELEEGKEVEFEIEEFWETISEEVYKYAVIIKK
jgi:hypothetical protein